MMKSYLAVRAWASERGKIGPGEKTYEVQTKRHSAVHMCLMSENAVHRAGIRLLPPPAGPPNERLLEKTRGYFYLVLSPRALFPAMSHRRPPPGAAMAPEGFLLWENRGWSFCFPR